MARILSVEKPYKDAESYEWTADSFSKFNLDASDVATMEEGRIVWIDEVAYSMEENDAQPDQ